MFMTLQNFWDISRKENIIAIPVSGDCLEGAGVSDGDIVIVDLTKMPLAPKYKKRDGYDYKNICLCFASPDRDIKPVIMVKEYNGTFGPMQQVGTRYKQKSGNYRMNYQFEPLAILGVVYECYSKDRHLKWSCDISGHPDSLVNREYASTSKECKSLPIIRNTNRMQSVR